MNQISVLYPEIDLLDEQGRSFVKLRQADEMHVSSISQTTALDLNSLSQFNNWLALTPSAGVAVASSNKQLMTCTFEYSKLVQAKDGSGAIGVVYKEGSNKFGAHGRFHEAKNLKSLITTGLILNVASQVLAQKHLADINERLKSIDQQIKGIRQFLEQSRMVKIEAFQEHLQRVGMLLKEGEHVHTDTLHLLAQKSQEVRAQVIHIGRDLEDANKEINDFDSSSWFGSNDLRDALKNKIGRIGHLQREYLIGLQCLLAANLILFIKHGGNKEFVIAGNSYLDELGGQHGLVEQWNVTKRRVNFHLSKMKPVFEWAKSTQANAHLVEAKVAEVQERISQDTAKVRELQQQLVHAQNPRVLLELEGQRVVRGYYL